MRTGATEADSGKQQLSGEKTARLGLRVKVRGLRGQNRDHSLVLVRLTSSFLPVWALLE